jgi:hypothetical protein
MGTSLRKKFYFLTPVTEFPPDSIIKLGSIISHPRLVGEPINHSPVAPQSFFENVMVHNDPNSYVTVDRSRGGHLSIFAEFLANIGINGEVKGDKSSSGQEQWFFENLQTIWFNPSNEYIAKSLEDNLVQEYIHQGKSWLGHSKLYLVTGIKIAYGAKSVLQYAEKHGIGFKLGVDLTPIGAPVNVGPDVGYHGEDKLKKGADGSDAFVFAFRLRQIKVSLAGEIKHQDAKKGTVIDINGPATEDSTQVFVETVDDVDDVDASEFQDIHTGGIAYDSGDPVGEKDETEFAAST